MPDTVPVPSWAGERDVQRALHIVRNVRIQSEYEQLQDEHGRDEAFKRLSDRFECSTDTVREVVYGRR